MKNLLLFAVLVSLPLLLGGCGEKEPVGKVQSAEGAPVKPNLKYEIKDGTVTITGCDKKASGELTIPMTIEGKTVTGIGNSAFARCRSLTSFTIPDSVTGIGDSAFADCTSLTSITIPDGVTSIGSSSFRACTNLTSITIPDGVTSIGDFTFRDCILLTNITIPDGVTSIGREAFSYCTSLTSITIPDGVTSVGKYAFSRCTSLTSITIPDGVTSVGYGAFYNCTSLTTIEVSAGNVNYTDVNGVLFNKEKTTLYTYPRGKTGANYTIPDSVTSIGSSAFRNCTSLTSVTIGNGVTSIGVGAFIGCEELRIINFSSDSPPQNVPDIISDSPRAAIRIKPNATGFGEVFGGLPIIDPDSITSIQSVELDTEIDLFPDGNGATHNVTVTVTVRSDIPVEFVTKSLNGTAGIIYENEIVTQFEKGQFPDGRPQSDIWIFEWQDSIPSSMPAETYAYSRISVTNFDGITSGYWPDISFSDDEILPNSPTRPIEFDGNYANWEFAAPDKGYGFFADEDLPYFTFKVTGDVASLGVTTTDRFDHPPFEALFGDADYVESNRLQCNGNSTAFFNIGFSDTVAPKSLGFAVTDLDLEDVIVRAWHKGDPIGKATINRWFRELFDSIGNTNKPSWDPEHNAVVAQRDEDGLLSEEKFAGAGIGSESASAWFFPDVPFDSLSLEYRNRLSGASSMHVYLASKKELDIINAGWLTSITTDGEVTIIDCDEAATGELVIPDTIEGNPVTSIGVFAFQACTGLTSITIPDSVTSIGDWAFDHCSSLTTVTFLGDAPKEGKGIFSRSTPTIYRKPEAKGWGDTWGGRPVKLISEKP